MSGANAMYLPNLSPFTERPAVRAASTFWENVTQAWPVVTDLPGVWKERVSVLEHLETHYGHLRLAELRGSYGLVIRPNHQAAFAGIAELTLREFLHLYRARTPGLPYLTHMSIKRNFPEMLNLFELPEAWTDNWIDGRYFTHFPSNVRVFLDDLGGAELFIGRAGHGFGPVHVDFMAVHVVFIQLSGEKRFILFPPSDGKYLYPTRGRMFPFQRHYTDVDVLDPQLLEKWPLVAKSSPMSVVLKPGQAMLLPPNWWHTTLNETDGVGYCARIINRSNIGLTAKECMLGFPRAALKALGR